MSSSDVTKAPQIYLNDLRYALHIRIGVKYATAQTKYIQQETKADLYGLAAASDEGNVHAHGGTFIVSQSESHLCGKVGDDTYQTKTKMHV